MLALTALTVLTLFVVSLLDSDALGATLDPSAGGAAAAPDTLEFYREHIIVGPDGITTVEITTVLGKGGSGDLLLPFTFGNSRDFSILSGPAEFTRDARGATRPVRSVLGQTMLDLTRVPGGAAGDTVRVRALLDGWFDAAKARRAYGESALSREFLNTSRFVLRSFELKLTLPPGTLVHSVTRVEPSFNPKKNPEPPYTIGQAEGRGFVVLRQQELAPAGRCGIDVNFRPARRGIIPLLLGLGAMVLYLIFFRDVLKSKEAE